MLTCLPSNLLEDIRKLSHTWQPEWMSVCKALRSATIEYRAGKTLLVPLWHKEQLAEQLKRIAADASLDAMPIRLTNPHWMFPWAQLHLRDDRVKKVPLPERMSAPFSSVAQRRYFRMHHNLHDVADCLVVCLESAAALGLSQRIRGVDLFLIAPDNEKTYAAYADEELLARLLTELPNLEGFTVRARAPRFRDILGYYREMHSFRGSFMRRLLSLVVAESTSLRRLTLVDASFPTPFANGLNMLDLAEYALAGYGRTCPRTYTLGYQWLVAYHILGSHEFAMPNLASRIELLRIENVCSSDFISDRFWAFIGSHQVARLELVNTQIEWPGAVRRGGPTIFPGGRISRQGMTLAVSTNTLPRGAEVQFDPAAFAAEGVMLE